MTRQITATEAKANFLALLDEVQSGEDIEVTRNSVTVARLSKPVPRPHTLKGMFRGVVTSSASDQELFSTGETGRAS